MENSKMSLVHFNTVVMPTVIKTMQAEFLWQFSFQKWKKRNLYMHFSMCPQMIPVLEKKQGGVFTCYTYWNISTAWSSVDFSLNCCHVTCFRCQCRHSWLPSCIEEHKVWCFLQDLVSFFWPNLKWAMWNKLILVKCHLKLRFRVIFLVCSMKLEVWKFYDNLCCTVSGYDKHVIFGGRFKRKRAFQPCWMVVW